MPGCRSINSQDLPAFMSKEWLDTFYRVSVYSLRKFPSSKTLKKLVGRGASLGRYIFVDRKGNMSWRCILLVSFPSPSPKVLSTSIPTERPPQPSHPYCFWRAVLPALLSLSLSATTTSSIAIAIPSLNSPLPLPTTPFSESKNLPLGLLDGKIMPCPSTNPGCISSNPKSSSFAFPWRITEGTRHQDPVQMLEEAILKTQKNPRIVSLEDTPYGVYLLAEFDGGFGRDVLEFLVKGDVVGYRSMATKVAYVYPFTTALGDSKGQEERLKKIIDQLGWSPTDNVRVAC